MTFWSPPSPAQTPLVLSRPWWSRPARTETGWPPATPPSCSWTRPACSLCCGSPSSGLCSRFEASVHHREAHENDHTPLKRHFFQLNSTWFWTKDENELTWREYMPLMVSLNCMVAERKMFSVVDSSLILVRRSFTWGNGWENEVGRHK